MTDFGWIKRRVETVELLDPGRWSRRVTLDVSWYEIQSRAKLAGIDPAQKLPILFVTLPKGLLDVDVVGDHGRSLSVLVSEQDSIAAALAANYDREQRAQPPTGSSCGRFEKLRQLALTDVDPAEQSQAESSFKEPISAGFHQSHPCSIAEIVLDDGGD